MFENARGIGRVPRVVAAGQHVDSAGEQALDDARGCSETAADVVRIAHGRVLGIRYDEIDRVLAPPAWNSLGKMLHRRTPDDVAEKEHPHPVTAPSSSVVKSGRRTAR